MHFMAVLGIRILIANSCTATAIPSIYSFSGNSAASAPISTFMCLWAIYISPGLVHIFPPAEKADPSWEYIIRSQTHECGNWDWGADIPFLGIFVSNFRHFVVAVCTRWRGIFKGLSQDGRQPIIIKNSAPLSLIKTYQPDLSHWTIPLILCILWTVPVKI